MTHLGNKQQNEQQYVPVLGEGGRALKAFLLQAAGARPRICAYCESMVSVGGLRCASCGATVTHEMPQAGETATPEKQWIIPLLLSVFFPPALLIIIPSLFWRWLRKANRGWLVPILICVFFPPAALIVAPALLWPSRKNGKPA